MKDFTRPRGRLRALPLAARVVYSVFLLFTFVALAMTAWLADDMVGLDAARVGEYYAGGVRAAKPSGATTSRAGPVLDLPADVEAALTAQPISTRKLLEVTHFHLFSMPVYLLILSHLFMLSRSRESLKIACIALGSAATAAHIAAPWFARKGALTAVVWYAGSGVLMTIAFAIMGLVPLWEMWAPTQRAAATRDAADE